MGFYRIDIFNKKNKLVSRYHKFASNEVNALKLVLRVAKLKSEDKIKIIEIK